MGVEKPVCNILSRHFSTKAKVPSFSNIPSKYRPHAIQEAQEALIDYLHTTRSLPYTFAEHIAKNSLFSLSNLTQTQTIRFSAPNFSHSFRKFLRYDPINEFQFLFESIGLNYDEIGDFLPPNKFFFYEDRTVLDAACALSGFGFPWIKLGKLYKEDRSIFCTSSSELKSRLNGFKCFCFNTVSIIAICLAFPHVLAVGEADRILFLDGLKKDVSGFCMGESGVEGDIDFYYEICTKIRFFYSLGLEKGKIGAQISKKNTLFIEFTEEVLAQRAEYFCRFDVKKEDVGLLLVRSPEILNLDLSTAMISVVGLLKHVGLGTYELNNVIHKYSHVLGRNHMANLPNIMRALDLNKWFFYEIMDDYQLLATYCLNSLDEDVDEVFSNFLEKIKLSRTPTHTMNKLKFLHGIGYGENSLTMKVLTRLHGTDRDLQERFDCLLRMGIEFSQLCSIIQTTPKILNQKPESLEQKVNFLCREIGSSLQYLDIFPAFLCFDLEKRMKPRYRFHMWLRKKGLCFRDYSIASIMATSEKNFVARIFGIHPAAPKHWFESFSYRTSAHN